MGDNAVGPAGGVVVRGQYCPGARLGSGAELFSGDRRQLPTRSGASRREGDQFGIPKASRKVRGEG